METIIKTKKTRTEHILNVMKVLAWIAFIGYAIEAGSILVSFIVSCINPEAAGNLYNKLNVLFLRLSNFWYYGGFALTQVLLSMMKSYVWFLVIKALQKINLVNPFTKEVARILERISYILFGIWILAVVTDAFSTLWEIPGVHLAKSDSGEFVFMAGLIFIISQIFKRGVEIQSENELTV